MKNLFKPKKRKSLYPFSTLSRLYFEILHFPSFSRENGEETQACSSKRPMAPVPQPSADPLRHHRFAAPFAASLAGPLPLQGAPLPRLHRRRQVVPPPAR